MTSTALSPYRAFEKNYAAVIESFNTIDDLILAKDKLISTELRIKYEEKCSELIKKVKDLRPQAELSCRRIIRTGNWDDITFRKDLFDLLKFAVTKGKEYSEKGKNAAQLVMIVTIFQMAIINLLLPDSTWKKTAYAFVIMLNIKRTAKAYKHLHLGQELLEKAKTLEFIINKLFSRWMNSIGNPERTINIENDISGMKFLARILQTS